MRISSRKHKLKKKTHKNNKLKGFFLKKIVLQGVFECQDRKSESTSVRNKIIADEAINLISSCVQGSGMFRIKNFCWKC